MATTTRRAAIVVVPFTTRHSRRWALLGFSPRSGKNQTLSPLRTDRCGDSTVSGM